MNDKNLKFIENYIDNISSENTLPNIEYRISHLLFYATYYEYSGLEQYKNKAIKLYENIVEDYDNHDLKFSLYEGIEGLGWACIYLNKCNVINDYSIFEDLLDYLYKSLNISIINHDWDLLYGYMGKMGVILSSPLQSQEARKNEYIVKILDDLNKTKVVKENGYFWFENREDEIVNLGLAHGLFSILLFLLKIQESGFESVLLKQLIDGTKNAIVLSVNSKKSISIFPNGISFNENTDSNLFSFSRLAWCYGDLGALYSLVKYNQKYKEEKIDLLINNLIEVLTLRGIGTSGLIHFSKEDFFDTGFCHGLSGIYYLLQISSNLLPNDKYLKKRINYWQEQININLEKISILNVDEVYYPNDFTSLSFPQKYEKDSFLNGYAGIGLTLLSIKYNRYGWSEFLLLG